MGEKKSFVYVEPEGYIPKDILKKYFPEFIEEEKDSWEKPKDEGSVSEEKGGKQ